MHSIFLKRISRFKGEPSRLALLKSKCAGRGADILYLIIQLSGITGIQLQDSGWNPMQRGILCRNRPQIVFAAAGKTGEQYAGPLLNTMRISRVRLRL